MAGYSEGGGVAMWTTRLLEQKPIAGNPLVASAPMSGPYDLSGVTAKFLVAPPANAKILTGRLYLMAYLVYSFQKSAGVRFVNYFTPGIAFAASQAFSGNRTDEAIIQRLGIAVAFTGAKTSMDRIVLHRFRNALTSGDARDPVIRELPRHDCYDWKPRTKILLVALASDALVTVENTETAMRAMRNNGIGANTLRRYILGMATSTTSRRWPRPCGGASLFR